MRFFLCFLFLLLICCDAKKAEKEILYSCEAGIDSILQASQIEYAPMRIVRGEGYIDGHCLDSEKSLLLYQDKWHQVLEYGNFKKGYYMVDSVALPLFDFETFNNRQQIVWQNILQNLYRYSGDPSLKHFRNNSDRSNSLMSIYPYKDKIFGSTLRHLIVMDFQKKSFEFLLYYKLFEFPFCIDRKLCPPFCIDICYSLPIPLNLINIKNDTLILSRRQSEDGFLDTLLIALDGENVIPKIKDSRCLEISFENRKSEYFGDKKRCFDH
jgi:hypothetical protein